MRGVLLARLQGEIILEVEEVVLLPMGAVGLLGLVE